MSRRGIWRTLGIGPTEDTVAIRRAYATRLRAMDPDADPDGFATLRAARDTALAMARDGADGAYLFDEAPAFPGSGMEDVRVSSADVTALLSPTLDDEHPAGDIAIPAPDPVDPHFLPLTAPPSDGIERTLDPVPSAASLTAPSLSLAGGDIVVRAADADAHYDRAYQRLYELLLPPRDAEAALWLTEDEEAEAHAHTDILLADPRLDTIDFGQDAERWFAHLLADAIPRSDALLDRVSRRFGWNARIGTVDLDDAAERVAVRAKSFVYAFAAANPDHSDHAMWKELTKPATERSWRSPFILRSGMRTYIARIRKTYPDAEGFWDPMRVAKWESTRGPRFDLWRGLMTVVVINVVIRGCLAIVQPDAVQPDPLPVVTVSPDATTADSAAPNPAPGGVPVKDRDFEIGLALSRFSDIFTLDVVKSKNPLLYRTLSDRWDDAKAQGQTVPQFVDETLDWLFARVPEAIHSAPRDLIATWRQMELSTITSLEQQGPAKCADYVDGKLEPSMYLTDATRKQRQRLLMEMLLLLSYLAPAEKQPSSFTVPASVMKRMLDSSSLPEDTIAAALQGRGSDADRCATRRALLQAALDTPRSAGLRLLRTM